MGVRFPDNADDGLDNVVLPGGEAITAREVLPDSTPLPPQAFQQPAPQPQISIQQIPQPAPQPAPQDDGFDIRRLMHTLGGGTALDYDKFKAQERESSLNNDMRRQQIALGNLDLQDRQEERHLKAQELRDSINPQSQLSQSTAAEMARLNNARAQMLADKNPNLAKMFATAAQGAAGRSRLDLMRTGSHLDTLWNNFTGMMNADAKNALASEGMNLRREGVQAQKDNAQATRQLGYARLGEDTRHNQTTEEIARNKVDEKLPAGGEIKTYRDSEEGLKKIERIKQLLASGKVRYMGYGAQALANLASKLPGKDPLTPEERELSGLLGWVAAPERHELFGASYTGTEKTVGDQLFADLSKNKESALSTLKIMEDSSRNRLDDMNALYPGIPKRLSKAKGPAKTPASQGSDKDKKALEWANANPNDPRAAEIKKRLGVK